MIKQFTFIDFMKENAEKTKSSWMRKKELKDKRRFASLSFSELNVTTHTTERKETFIKGS